MSSFSGLPRPGGGSRIPPTPGLGRPALQAVAQPNTDSLKMPPPPKPGIGTLKHRPATAASTNSRNDRVSLVDRAAQPASKQPKLSHSRSSSNMSVTPGLSKSVGSRPTTSLGFARNAPSAVVSSSRPTSAQSMNTEDEEEPEVPKFRLPKRQGWDIKSKLADHEEMFKDMRELMAQDRAELRSVKDTLAEKQNKEVQLETMRVTLESTIAQTRFELDSSKKKTAEFERSLEDERRNRRIEKDEAARRLRDETDDLRRRHRIELEDTAKSHREQLDMMERKLKLELMDEKAARTREVDDLKSQAALEKKRLESQLDGGGRVAKELNMELENLRSELQRERTNNSSLKNSLSEQDTATFSLQTQIRTLNAHIEVLEGQGNKQAQSYAELEQKLKDALEETAIAKEKLRNEEAVRRKLHNQIQELKGNIRVFCRVRPPLELEQESLAEVKYPDSNEEGKELTIRGEPEFSSLGKDKTETKVFSFDKVFGPKHQNNEIFEEISQLVQSALDGYNVCIFCYGQTGSGKTYTMSAPDGMIPQGVHQIYETAKRLEEKGWSYKMEGSFVEIYNEEIHDLLGKNKKNMKHKIQHDEEKMKTTITNVETVMLENPSSVDQILQRASNVRSTAATAANAQSSRSHSVFMLTLRGKNSMTGVQSEAKLSLVDLAGSERLDDSQATGDRLRETRHINKSLSALSKVIQCLGNNDPHIPYRDSKLTDLLKFSLGGNSKTLMFCMISPLVKHTSESLSTLAFATRVNSTSIGTAKKQIKVN